MSASDDALHNLTAQWYNSLTAALSLSPKDFQITQGDLLVPTSTERLWDMMNQVPSESIAQYYTPSTVDTFSSDYQSILSYLQEPASEAFKTAMSTDYAAWQTAEQAYVAANGATILANPPTSVTKALTGYFDVWSAENMDPGKAASCATLYAAIYDNPVYIAQLMIRQLSPGAPTAFTMTQEQVIADLGHGTSVTFSMDSATASTDLSNSWTSSSSSDGGTYFYTSSSSSEATDFTQKFASSEVTVSTTYQHVVTVPVQPLSSGTVADGGADYSAWFYPAALTAAFQDDTSSTWSDPTKWSEFFGSEGSLQYVTTALIVVDGITQTITSNAAYTADEQTYAHSESHEGYGCWPYYVSSDSSSTATSNTTFNDQGQMTVTINSPVNNPVVIGVLVSAIKDLDTGVVATAGATRPALEPAE
jgi:hypothetical protein